VVNFEKSLACAPPVVKACSAELSPPWTTSGCPSPLTSAITGAPRKSSPWAFAGKPGSGAPEAASWTRM
jgi:hypothetical protein